MLLQYGLLAGHPLGESGDGPGHLASIVRPEACAADGAGNVFVVDQDGSIRRIGPDGAVSWYAGGSTLGGSDGARTEAGFGKIQAMAVDPWGDLYLAD